MKATVYFCCPSCTQLLKHPTPGEKVHCPVCDQRIQVPHPSDRKSTVLATPAVIKGAVTAGEARRPESARTPAPDQAGDQFERLGIPAFRISVVVIYGLVIYGSLLWVISDESALARGIARACWGYPFVFQLFCLFATAVASLLTLFVFRNPVHHAKVVAGMFGVGSLFIGFVVSVAGGVTVEAIKRWLGW